MKEPPYHNERSKSADGACFGPGVPVQEIEAFAAVFQIARKHAEHDEAMLAAVRAGAAESQRRKVATRGGGGERR